MQIPRFGLVASLGMTKQVGESRFEDCSLRERSFRSVEWRELELRFIGWLRNAALLRPRCWFARDGAHHQAHPKRRFQSPEMVHDRLEPKGPKATP